MDERTIPYFVHEGDMTRMERSNKRLFVIIIILIFVVFMLASALIISNVAWIKYENQFEDVVTTIEAEQETEDGGNNYIVGGDYNGETENKGDNQEKSP